VERNRKAGQNPPRGVAPTEEEEEEEDRRRRIRRKRRRSIEGAEEQLHSLASTPDGGK
jgi:hypothetical protein